jgi:hypothetical protein
MGKLTTRAYKLKLTGQLNDDFNLQLVSGYVRALNAEEFW